MPVRVLHLLDTDADFQTRRAVEYLARDLGHDFAAAANTIGRGGTCRGLPAAVARVRGGERFDVIHAWGTTALTAAAFGSRAGARIVFTPPTLLTRRTTRW